MKNYTILFLILTLVTGLIGFAGWNFAGIGAIRIGFLIFADLLIISLLAKMFFSDSRRLKPIKVKK